MVWTIFFINPRPVGAILITRPVRDMSPARFDTRRRRAQLKKILLSTSAGNWQCVLFWSEVNILPSYERTKVILLPNRQIFNFQKRVLYTTCNSPASSVFSFWHRAGISRRQTFTWSSPSEITDFHERGDAKNGLKRRIKDALQSGAVRCLLLSVVFVRSGVCALHCWTWCPMDLISLTGELHVTSYTCFQ